MKKVLYIASITRHILSFHMPYIKLLYDNDFEVSVATNDNTEIPYCAKHYVVPFSRSPFHKDNITAYKELKKIVTEEKFDLVICNTPVASALTRLACKKTRKNGTRVIYFAHGFHFCKGAPIINWILFYPLEKYLSKYTDDLITITDEDYEIAKEKMKAVRVHHVHGVGVDLKEFTNNYTEEEKRGFRGDLLLSKDDFIFFFAGELNKNKNQGMMIEALQSIVPNHPNVRLLLAGEGVYREKLTNLINELGIQKNVILLGYRKDIKKLLSITDVYISMSLREGLPVNILEARAMNLPIVASINRGQKELISDRVNGTLVNAYEVSEVANAMEEIIRDESLRNKYRENARNNIEKYAIENVFAEVKKIYLS